MYKKTKSINQLLDFNEGPKLPVLIKEKENTKSKIKMTVTLES